MGRNTMGSAGKELITAKEAAELLGITAGMVRKLARSGLLSPTLKNDGKKFRQFYDRSEISVLMGLRATKMNLPEVANTAVRALALAQINERRIDEVRSMLGMDIVPLSVEEQDVLLLYMKAQDARSEDRQPGAEEITSWARTLLSITESYLRVVSLHTGDEDPWKDFMLLADKWLGDAPREQFSTNRVLQAAYSLLEIGRRHLRQVAYFYSRSQHGRDAAGLKFPNVEGGVDEVLIGLLFLH